MARKPIQKPEGTPPSQEVASGLADPAQTSDSQPQPLAGTQGAAATEQGGTPQTPPEGEGPVLTVKGPAKGRWRVGRFWPAEAVTVPARDLTEAQIEALFNDPALTVTVA